MTTTFADYLLVSAAEMPLVDILHLESASTLNALGVKGVGESGVIPVAGAIMSAIDDALSDLDIHIDCAPISPQALCKRIRTARNVANPVAGRRVCICVSRRQAMKPAAFRLHRPSSVEEAVSLLAAVADKRRAYSGGWTKPRADDGASRRLSAGSRRHQCHRGARPRLHGRWAPCDRRYGAARLLPSSGNRQIGSVSFLPTSRATSRIIRSAYAARFAAASRMQIRRPNGASSLSRSDGEIVLASKGRRRTMPRR